MSFSFNEDLGDNVSQVRFLIGDIASPGTFSDELINGTLTLGGSVNEAAALLAEQLAAKYSSMSDISVDGLSISNSDRAARYEQLAIRLRRGDTEVNGIGDPTVGGVSISEANSIENETDRSRAKFRTIGEAWYPPEIEP